MLDAPVGSGLESGASEISFPKNKAMRRPRKQGAGGEIRGDIAMLEDINVLATVTPAEE
jgi:hypothetical protein